MTESHGAQQNHRILVVDDEYHVRNTVVALLTKQGYAADAFDNGSEALVALQQGGADLVLTDVKMPGMDGVELLGRLRAMDPEIPVILMTAYAHLDMAISAIKHGTYDFIIKPFDRQSLLATIERGLRYRNLCQLEKDHLARLEEAVAEKTRELQGLHSQLVLSEKMAAIGLLAAGVAHEINNPVAFIASNLSSLGKYANRLTEFTTWQTGLIAANCGPDIHEEQERYRRAGKIDYLAKDMGVLVEESLEGVERIKRIVSSLKSFARQDDDQPVAANLNDLVESTLTIVWNEIKYVATLDRELGDLPDIKCYPSQLSQVIVNLLVNGAHAIGEGPGTISVRTWANETAVNLEVRDSGCGISVENRERIFSPFFTTKEIGKGTGLGLSICSDIVARHKGSITVESEVGKGSAFTVSLPKEPE